MKQVLIQLLIVILGINISFAQSERKRANYWHFGSKAGLDFSCLPPQSFFGSELTSGEGSASISDLDGNLLMYTNGKFVWDANDNVMPNGTGLLGHPSTVQSSIIIPKPGNPNIYYIFTGGTSIEEHGQIGVHFSEVDMTLNGGMGDVTANKNIFLFSPNEEKLTAVANASGNGYWVVAQKYHSAEWYAYEVTSAGVNTTPVISTTGPIARFENSLDAKLSPDGTLLASQNQCDDNYNSSICLYSFNNSTGVIDFLWEDCGGAGGSLEFSPDATKLYAATNLGINQYDLTAGSGITDSMAIIGSKTTIMTPSGGVGSHISIQLANDCKIYVSEGGLSSGASFLSVIDKPNLAGAACNYILDNTALVSGTCLTRLTNFVSSFFYEGCPELAFDLNVTDAECQADGSIDLVITAGTPPFYYNWSNGASTEDISGINGGWYVVTVTDEFGNCVKDSAYVEQNQQTVTIEETLTNPTECGSTDGEIDLVISPVGGATEDILIEDFETNGEGSRYTTVGLQDPGTNNKFFKRGIAGNFNWFGSPSLSGENGAYYFGVRNSGNSPVSLTLNSTAITGYYDVNVCVLLASIGNPKANDYYKVEYQIDGGNWVTLTEFRRSAPPYKLAEDTNGDGLGDGVQLTDVFQDFCFSIPTTGNQIGIRVVSNASGSTSGFAFDYIRVTGIPPLTYTIQWTPDGETTSNISDKSHGTYEVEITTSTGCVVTESYTLHDPCSCIPPVLQINPLEGCLPNQIDLNNAIDPSSDVATATFYNSENNADDATFAINNLVTASGSYWVRAEDPNDPTCFAVYEIQVVLTEITFTTIITNPSCGANDGEIIISPDTEFNITSYSIDDNVTTQSDGAFSNLSAGTYTVVITDENGCEASEIVNLNNLNGPTITVVDNIGVSCFGGNDGSVEVTATGGTAPYTFSWSPSGGNDATASDLFAGEYTVTVTDDEGCSNQLQVTLNEPELLIVNETLTDAFCGEDNGGITLNVTGGTENYSYTWIPNVSSTNGATNLAAGSYEVTVKDENECSQTATYILDAEGSFYIDAIPDEVTISHGESASLDVLIDPNVTVNSILWNPSIGLSCVACTDPVASPNATTTYFVTVTDENGCSATDSVVVIVKSDCDEVLVPTIFSPNADGLNDLQCVLGTCIVSLDFTIINRWGQVVFHSVDQANCWDGTFNGKPVQTGAYVFTLKATLVSGELIEQTGNINVMR